MTTPAAARLYLAQHQYELENRGIVIYNPHNKNVSELPTITAFSNAVGGGDGICFSMAEDGNVLGSHWCSNEGYAESDLGVLVGTRNDRHEESYQKHYPSGYRMRFVSHDKIKSDEILQEAFRLNKLLADENNSNN